MVVTMTVRQFLRWWGAQLLSLLPSALRRNPAAGRTVSVLIDQSRVEVRVPGAGKTEPLSVEEARLIDLHGKVDAVAVQLGPKDYLVRHLTLPRLALSNLAETVGYQIPKLLPFTRDQVLFACGSSDAPAPAGQASVWLAAVPRRRLQTHLAALDIDLPDSPIVPHEPPTAGQPMGFSWRLTRQSQRQAFVRRALWLGLAATWLVAIGLLVHDQQREYDALLAVHDDLRKDAVAVGKLRERLDLAEAQFDALMQRRQVGVSPLGLLNELTTVLDDGTWLINLELQGDELSLQGVSTTPAALIETLEDSSLLSAVRFDAAITQAGREAGSRFNISAKTSSPSPEALP
jgi:general secretion pathway protein L